MEQEILNLINEELDKRISEIKQELIRFAETLRPKNGQDGKTPTKEELLVLIKPLIPSPIPGKEGKQGPKGDVGTPGKDGESIIGISGKDGKDGKDAILTPELLNDFFQENPLEIKNILGLEMKLKEIVNKIPYRRGIIGGVQRGNVGTAATITGTINGSNKVFTLSLIPRDDANLFLYLNGKKQKLTTDYTRSNATITYVVAPLSGDDHEAIVFAQ